MQTAKLIWDGPSQVVILPEGCQFESDHVLVKKCGDAVMLFPNEDAAWQLFRESLDEFTPDFMEQRDQPSDDSDF